MQNALLLSIIALMLTTSSCSIVHPHRYDVQQGNIISPEMRVQVKKGMTKQQVLDTLGTPLHINLFDGDRWDYVFYFRENNDNSVELNDTAIIFDNNHVKKVIHTQAT